MRNKKACRLLLLTLGISIIFHMIIASAYAVSAESNQDVVIESGVYAFVCKETESTLEYEPAVHCLYRPTYQDTYQDRDGNPISNRLFYIWAEGNGLYTITPLAYLEGTVQLNGGKVVVDSKKDAPEEYWKILPTQKGFVIRSGVNEAGISCDTVRNICGGYDLVADPASQEITWELVPADAPASNYRVYVRVPDHWIPLIETVVCNSEVFWSGSAVMTKGNDGWYYRSGQGQTEVRITNWLYFPDGAIYYPDRSTAPLALQPDSDVWIVISDDPNVTGDISWEISYTNPDESSPKTSDDIADRFALVLMCGSVIGICAVCILPPCCKRY